MSTKALLHKFMGTAAAGGHANFFEPGTSTPKATYTSTTYATEEAAKVPISSDGWLKTYLLGDYDMDVFDKNGNQLASASADGINPQAASVANDPNLVPNGSFETDSDEDGTPDGWVLTSFAGSTNARVSSDQRHGAHAMSFTSTGSGGGHLTTSDFIPVNPDVTVYIGFALKSTAADVRNVVDILWFTEAEATVSTTSVYDEDTNNPTSWEFKSFHATPPATARYAKIRLYGCHSSDSTAGTTLYDDVKFKFVTDKRGQYTGTLTGLTTTPTVTVNYSINGDVVTINSNSNISGTSDASAMSIAGAPAEIRPTGQAGVGYCVLTDNGSLVNAGMQMLTSGSLQFLVNGDNSGFTSSGTKGIPSGRHLSYTYKLTNPS